ncbi:MAG: hypothetical protein ACPG3V_05950 [Porticoccaceae bacterium]
MSKSIKLLMVIAALCLAAACCGCGPPLYQIYFDQLFYDDQDVLVLGYRAHEDNPDNITKFAKLNTETYKWQRSEVARKVIADEEISTSDGKTIIMDGNGAVVFEQAVPSISDIENQTGILLPEPKVFYDYFRAGVDYRWDRKTVIVNIGINTKVDGMSYSFTSIHSFLAEYDEINSLWNIQHLREIIPRDARYWDNSSITSIWREKLFVNSNISLCQGWMEQDYYLNNFDDSIKCLVKYEDGQVSLQKLYGEIIPTEYSGIIQKLYNSTDHPRVFFDGKQRLYAFYNATKEAKGEYFYFEMYKPDNPTVAQHKQKIYWE